MDGDTTSELYVFLDFIKMYLSFQIFFSVLQHIKEEEEKKKSRRFEITTGMVRTGVSSVHIYICAFSAAVTRHIL